MFRLIGDSKRPLKVRIARDRLATCPDRSKRVDKGWMDILKI